MTDSGYDFYLKKCLLPIAPQKLTVKINNANSTVTLINDGEINILKQAGLTDIDFECRIPQEKYPFSAYESGMQNADYFLNYFEALKTGREPFQFIVCRKRPDGKKFFDTDIRVSMEDYQITEDAKNGFDILVKVKLKQWKDYGTKTVNVSFDMDKPKASMEPQREAANSPAPAAAQSYTVAKGDCLWNIAKKYYGNGSKYTVIYNANKSVIGGNPNLIYPGQVLTIPAV
mgnify:CR=1 FL=1